METWAHGLDVHAAVGAPPADTDRLAHVAWLATRALPYAYTVAGREPPAGRSGSSSRCRRARRGRTVPTTPPNRITGPASEYCRVFVQRLSPRDAAVTLVADGAGADAALDVARAYL